MDVAKFPGVFGFRLFPRVAQVEKPVETEMLLSAVGLVSSVDVLLCVNARYNQCQASE